MIVSGKLVDIIERNADELTKKWMDLVRDHPGTRTYRDYNERKLYHRAFSVYSQLGKWLSADTTKEDIKIQYTALGAQRYSEGFQLSEVIQALVITRRVLWFKVQSDGLLDTALDLSAALDLNNAVIVFFDRAIYFATAGFETAADLDEEADI